MIHLPDGYGVLHGDDAGAGYGDGDSYGDDNGAGWARDTCGYGVGNGYGFYPDTILLKS